MNILQAFSLLSLSRGGGTADRVYKISRALAQRGHSVSIYSSSFKLEQEYSNSLKGISVYPFRSIINLPGIHIMPGLISEAARNLKQFDIIHMHSQRSFQNVVLHHFAHKYHIPFVIDAHGSAPIIYRKKLKHIYDQMFGNKIYHDCSRFIADIELGIREYQGLGIQRERITLIPPSFPIEDFDNLPPPGKFRNEYNIQEKHIIMFLGRIHWIKGIDFLVQAFHEICQKRQDCILAIVGADDGYRSKIESLVNKLALSQKVLFTGFLGGERKLAALVDADMVIQTSRYEQHAWAPFEALLCGTPILVSSHTGAGEDVKRIDAGYLVKFDDSSNIAETINKVLENPTEARQKTRNAAKFIRDNLALDKRMEEYEKVYLDCIEENRR
jgi:glycosyltransferase involved in cell wall biosynthesis